MNAAADCKPVDVLLVEDNPDAVLIAREALTGSGFIRQLHVIEDGEEALNFLRKSGRYQYAPRPGFVLLDLNLPKKSGLQVLKEIKQDETLKEVPVIIMTSSESETDIQACYRHHANCFVVKPVDPDKSLYFLKSIMHFWLTIATLPCRMEV